MKQLVFARLILKRWPLILALLALTPAYAMVGDWVNQIKFEAAVPAGAAPTAAMPAITFPCGQSGTCNLEKFFKQQNVCALFVMHASKPAFAKVSETSDNCRRSASRNRYGIASVTKSITSVLVGGVIADEAGLDLNMSAADALSPSGLRYPNPAVTLHDLLTDSSGMIWSEQEMEGLRIETNPAPGQPTRHVEALATRLANAQFNTPVNGRFPFNYSSFDAQLLAIIAETHLRAGKTLADRFRDTIWADIAPDHPAYWKADDQLRPVAYCCFYIAPDDLAKIGQWVLDHYRNDTGAIGDWLRASVSNARDTPRECEVRGMRQQFRYGYQWWVLSGSGNGFTAIGSGGQFLHIFPEQDVVVVQLGDAGEEPDRAICEAMLVHRLIADNLAGQDQER